MIKKNKIIAIILARMGSKGLKNKNLKKLGLYPLVAWPIKSAKKSKYVDKIVVSTDSKKIARISKKYGAEIPFLRPKKISSDKSSSFDAIKHCLNYFQNTNQNFDYIVLLEPTSPFTSYKDIDKAITLLLNKSKSFDSLVSVYPAINEHVEFIYKMEKNNKLKKINNSKKKFIRRQDISKYFYLDGSIYISKVKNYLKNKSFIGKKTISMVMPKIKSMEIDDHIDLFIANASLSILKKNE